MKKLLFCAAFLIPLIAFGQSNASDLPHSCKSKEAHDMEMANIPYILNIPSNGAHIVGIITMASPGFYEYAPGYYKLDCYLRVVWSDQTEDYVAKFSTWEAGHGRIMVSYESQLDG